MLIFQCRSRIILTVLVLFIVEFKSVIEAQRRLDGVPMFFQRYQKRQDYPHFGFENDMEDLKKILRYNYHPLRQYGK